MPIKTSNKSSEKYADENAEALRYVLAMIGWSQADLVGWINLQGHAMRLRTVERWLSDAPPKCPGWPVAMLRLAGLVDTTAGNNEDTVTTSKEVRPT